MPQLSIITINFNNLSGLKRTIDSVVNQTWKDFEFIIIDGGSTDGSKALIEQYQDKIDYWVSEPDRGVYDAMNKGILNSNGNYLHFLNSGDWFVNMDTLNNIFFELPDCDLLYGNHIKVNSQGERIKEKQVKQYPFTFRLLFNGTINHQSAFISRKLFDRYGLYDNQLKIASDWKFFLIAIGLNNAKINYKNIDIVYYDISGISSNKRKLLNFERLQVLNELVPLSILADYKSMEADNIRLGIIRKYKFTSQINRLVQSLLIRLSRSLDKFIGA